MPDELSIIESGDPDSHPFGALLQDGLQRALRAEHKIPDFLFAIEGMSGRNYRAWINNVIGSMQQPRYLEIGSWAGSTCCAVIYGNQVSATCIDNWSLFGGPRDKFFANTARCRNEGVSLACIEADFRSVDYAAMGKFNVYLFDGPHEQEDQRDGVLIAQPALDDTHILIVDDWNWRPVRLGTFEGIKRAGLETLYSVEVRSTQTGTQPKVRREKSDWHNGYFVGVMKKR